MSFGAGAFKMEAVVVSIQDRGFSGFANNMRYYDKDTS